MSVQKILDITTTLEKRMVAEREKFGSLKYSDPETWDHFLMNDVLDVIETYTLVGTSEETEALQGLHRIVRQIADEALLSNDLAEAEYVFSGSVMDILVLVAEKNRQLNKEVLANIEEWAQDPDTLNSMKSWLKWTEKDVEAIVDFNNPVLRQVEGVLNTSSPAAEPDFGL